MPKAKGFQSVYSQCRGMDQTWILTKMEEKQGSVQRGVESSVLGITIMNKDNCKWMRADLRG